MTDKGTKEQKGWLNTLARVILFYVCTVVVIISTSALANNISTKLNNQLSALLATILTFSLILVFIRWEKLDLNDVGIVPGKMSAARFSIGFIGGLSMAIMQAMIV
ncbi:hypothetical protein B0O79_3369 [Flavobacteriaceae bacterium MAR_2009_75]|nr:hypothetical protein B0O79_3369 [Flavobacteriaceae bacterium MAR_2009_75]